MEDSGFRLTYAATVLIAALLGLALNLAGCTSPSNPAIYGPLSQQVGEIVNAR